METFRRIVHEIPVDEVLKAVGLEGKKIVCLQWYGNSSNKRVVQFDEDVKV